MFRALRPDEIELRVGTVSKGGKGFSLLCYKDARCDQNILDEVYGSEYWQRDHKEIKGNMYGGVGVYNKEIGEWIWKWDCGAESYTEKEKGEASDSFKRACFNLGIGRELYSSPFIWIAGHMDKDKPDSKFVNGLRVSNIEYTETESKREISKLQIKDRDGLVVFSYGYKETKKAPAKESKQETANAPQLSRVEMLTKIKGLADTKGITVDEICQKVKVAKLGDLTDDRLEKCIDWLRGLQK